MPKITRSQCNDSAQIKEKAFDILTTKKPYLTFLLPHDISRKKDRLIFGVVFLRKATEHIEK